MSCDRCSEIVRSLCKDIKYNGQSVCAYGGGSVYSPNRFEIKQSLHGKQVPYDEPLTKSDLRVPTGMTQKQSHMRSHLKHSIDPEQS